MKQRIIEILALQPHVEGGYFRRIYASEQTVCPDGADDTRKKRPLLTSIYYLLTDDSPIGYLHKNRSDIVHYFLRGSPIQYRILSPQGTTTHVTLGTNLALGQQPTLVVRGGDWKTSELAEGEYSLIAEAVAPGFDYEDMQLADSQQIKNLGTGVYETFKPFIKPV